MLKDVEKYINQLILNDDIILDTSYIVTNLTNDSYRPTISTEVYNKEIEIMKQLMNTIAFYVEPENYPRINYQFTFIKKDLEFLYKNRDLECERRYNNKGVAKKVSEIIKEFEAKCKEKIEYDISCALNYEREGYVYVTTKIICSLCLIEPIIKKKGYAVCYLCSTNNKKFYIIIV